MRIGIVTNSELSLPLLYSMQGTGAAPKVYMGKPGLYTEGRQKLLAFCAQSQVALLQEREAADLYRWLDKEKPEAVIVMDYDQKINLGQCKVPKGMFNVHFGPLPEYRGANPVFWQLRQGVTELGLCIHRLTEQMDAGPVFWQKSIPVQEWFNYTLVNQLFSQIAVEGLGQLLRLLSIGVEIPAKAQDESKARSFNRPGLPDVLLDWEAPASQATALIRACSDWNRGALAAFKGSEVKVMDAYADSVSDRQVLPGTVTGLGYTVDVACSAGEVLRITAMMVNDMFVPARLAPNYGFAVNSRFTEKRLLSISTP